MNSSHLLSLYTLSQISYISISILLSISTCLFRVMTLFIHFSKEISFTKQSFSTSSLRAQNNACSTYLSISSNSCNTNLDVDVLLFSSINLIAEIGVFTSCIHFFQCLPLFFPLARSKIQHQRAERIAQYAALPSSHRRFFCVLPSNFCKTSIL